MIKYITHALNENASKRKLCNTHTVCSNSQCPASYTFDRSPNTAIGVSLYLRRRPPSQCTRPAVTTFSPSAGCSAAPPGLRRRRPGRPGARPSSRRPPPSCLRCWGDLKGTCNDVTRGKRQGGCICRKAGFSYSTARRTD